MPCGCGVWPSNTKVPFAFFVFLSPGAWSHFFGQVKVIFGKINFLHHFFSSFISNNLFFKFDYIFIFLSFLTMYRQPPDFLASTGNLPKKFDVPATSRLIPPFHPHPKGIPVTSPRIYRIEMEKIDKYECKGKSL